MGELDWKVRMGELVTRVRWEGGECGKPFWILELFDCFQDVKYN